MICIGYFLLFLFFPEDILWVNKAAQVKGILSYENHGGYHCSTHFENASSLAVILKILDHIFNIAFYLFIL